MLVVSGAQEEYTLWGYNIPFPRKDLYVALGAVFGFLPITVLVHTLLTRLYAAVRGSKSHSA